MNLKGWESYPDMESLADRLVELGNSEAHAWKTVAWANNYKHVIYEAHARVVKRRKLWYVAPYQSDVMISVDPRTPKKSVY